MRCVVRMNTSKGGCRLVYADGFRAYQMFMRCAERLEEMKLSGCVELLIDGLSAARMDRD